MLGIEILKPALFYGRLAKGVTKSLNTSGLQYRPVADGGYQYVYIARRADATGNRPPLLPFVMEGDLVTHWAAVVVRLNSTLTPLKVDHVSLKIYKGLETEDKTLLIRAEWDSMQAPHLKHGQPHWHVHIQRPRSDTAMDPGGELITEIGQSEPVRHEDWPYFHIHYPMFGRFDNGVKWCVPAPVDEKMLVGWIEDTLKYLQDEIGSLWKGARPAV